MGMEAETSPGGGSAWTPRWGVQMPPWSTPPPWQARSSASTRSTSRDVESAKAASRKLLDGGGADPEPRFTDGEVTVDASPGWLSDDVDNVHDVITEPLAGLDLETGYVAVQAYLDRHRDAALADVRTTIASATERPVTFGWGPRFLHSTGQYHKGGPSTGVYLQVTGQPERDLAVPDRPFTFHEFLIAQAVGDGQVLAEKGRPVLRLHLDGPGSRTPYGRRSRESCHWTNPLRDPRDRRLPRIAGPCGMVLFGVTGDLSRKKVMPAIYDLANRGLLPPGFSLVGFARRDWANQDFAAIVHDSVKQYARTEFPRRSGSSWPRASGSSPGTSRTTSRSPTCARTLDELDVVRGTGGNHALLPRHPAAGSSAMWSTS